MSPLSPELEGMEKKRQNLIKELIDTEEQYVQALSTVKDVSQQKYKSGFDNVLSRTREGRGTKGRRKEKVTKLHQKFIDTVVIHACTINP